MAKRTGPALAAIGSAVLLCGCGGHTATAKPKVAVQRPRTPLSVKCAGQLPFDARTILGFKVEAARSALKRRGCTIRVLERAGEPLAHAGEYVPGRIDVGVADQRVVRIIGES